MTWERALLAVVVAVAIVAVGLSQYSAYKAQKTITSLQNEIARRDVTIKVQDGLYTKLAQNFSDIKAALDQSTVEGKALAAEIKKQRSELASVTNAVFKLQDQIAQGTGIVSKPNPNETRVDFKQDFNLFRVSGFTLAPSGKYELKLVQKDELKIAVALAKQADGSWRTFITTSEPSMAVNIGVTGIDEGLFAPKWYEKFKLTFGLGASISGAGLIGDVGAMYKVGHFDIGPKIWATTNNGGNAWYGIGLGWSPFER